MGIASEVNRGLIKIVDSVFIYNCYLVKKVQVVIYKYITTCLVNII